MPMNRDYTCSNPSCGKVFNNPLKAENVGTRKGQRYEACPYCLTELTIDASSQAAENESKPFIQSVGRDETDREIETSPTEPKIAQPVPSAQCTHQLGYLSKRTSKGQIPDECMMCSSIVQCMLRNVTGSDDAP